MKKSKVYYDNKADVLYFVLKEGPEEKNREIAPGVNLELGEKGELLGVEILRASKVLGVRPKLKDKILESVQRSLYKCCGISEADTIRTKKIEIEVAAPDPDTGKSSASIGEATIIAGETELTIETTAVKADSKIFVTATTSTGGQALVVIEKVTGESFTVNLDSPLPSDITFDWWIVQVAAANTPSP